MTATEYETEREEVFTKINAAIRNGDNETAELLLNYVFYIDEKQAARNSGSV